MEGVTDEARSDVQCAPRGGYVLWGVMILVSLLIADLYWHMPSFLYFEIFYLGLIGFFFLHKLPFTGMDVGARSMQWRRPTSIGLMLVAQWGIFAGVSQFGWVTFFIASFAPENPCLEPFEGILCQMAHSDGSEYIDSGSTIRISLFKARNDSSSDICHNNIALATSDVKLPESVRHCARMKSYYVIYYGR